MSTFGDGANTECLEVKKPPSFLESRLLFPNLLNNRLFELKGELTWSLLSELIGSTFSTFSLPCLVECFLDWPRICISFYNCSEFGTGPLLPGVYGLPREKLSESDAA